MGIRIIIRSRRGNLMVGRRRGRRRVGINLGKLHSIAIRSQHSTNFIPSSQPRAGRTPEWPGRISNHRWRKVSRVDLSPARRGYLCVPNRWTKTTPWPRSSARRLILTRYAKTNSGGSSQTVEVAHRNMIRRSGLQLRRVQTERKGCFWTTASWMRI